MTRQTVVTLSARLARIDRAIQRIHRQRAALDVRERRRCAERVRVVEALKAMLEKDIP